MKNKMKFALSILATAVASQANAADCRIGAYLSDGSITRVTQKNMLNCQLNLDRLPVTDDLWIDTSTLTNVTIVGRKPRKHIRLDTLRINNVVLKNRVAAVDIGYSAVAGVTGLQIGDKLTNTGLTQLSFFQPTAPISRLAVVGYSPRLKIKLARLAINGSVSPRIISRIFSDTQLFKKIELTNVKIDTGNNSVIQSARVNMFNLTNVDFGGVANGQIYTIDEYTNNLRLKFDRVVLYAGRYINVNKFGSYWTKTQISPVLDSTELCTWYKSVSDYLLDGSSHITTSDVSTAHNNDMWETHKYVTIGLQAVDRYDLCHKIWNNTRVF